MEYRTEIMDRPSEEEQHRRTYLSDIDNLFRRIKWDLSSMLNPMDETRVPLRKYVMKDFIPINLKDEGDRFTIQAELPGVRREDIEVTMMNNTLTISVMEKEETEKREPDYLLKEMSRFYSKRTIRIPEDVKEDEAKAKMVDGVLILDIPKRHPTAPKTPRKIKVQ